MTTEYANVKQAIKKYGVDVNVLGNKKGADYAKKHPELDRLAVARISEANEPKANRLAEIDKLAVCFSDAADTPLKKGELMGYVKSLGLTLDSILLNTGLKAFGVEVKSRGKKVSESAPVSEAAPSDGFRTLNKEESYFFDALLTMMRDEDIETAQNLVAKRIENEMKDEIKKVTEARLSGLNALRKQHKAIQGTPDSE